MSKIFISYSHDSPEHAARVLALADQLIQDGLDCVLDQYVGDPPEGWPQWMDREIKAAEYVLMICTETYYQRVMGEEKPGKGLGVRWEGRLIYQHIYQAEANNPKFIPVLFEADHVRFIPTPLQGGTFYTLDSEDGYEKLYWRLTGQYKVEKPTPGQIKKRPPHERKPLFEKTSQPGGVRLSSEKIFLAKLPTTGGELYGRENELKLLDDAWNDPQTHIFTFVAWGGVGKTALVNHWLNRIEHDNYRGAERVYGWTFYSQGAREGSQASADEFFAHARKWFGDPDPTQGSPWDKGVRLAGLIRQQRTLLILDGLEPLQYPAGELGKLKDQGLQALLKELCRANPGLCLITTRLAIKDLAHVEMVVACSPSADPGCHCEERSDEAISTGSGSESAPRDCFAALAMTPFTKSRTAKRPCRRMYLEQLAPAAGAQLLAQSGVKGTLAERQQASQEFKGHALALNLLGRYLAVVHDGEIRKRDLIPHLTEEEEQGGHARRVMESYEKWLQGTPELDILYIRGIKRGTFPSTGQRASGNGGGHDRQNGLPPAGQRGGGIEGTIARHERLNGCYPAGVRYHSPGSSPWER